MLRIRKKVFLLCGPMFVLGVLYPIMAYAPALHVSPKFRPPPKSRRPPTATSEPDIPATPIRAQAPGFPTSPARKLTASSVAPAPPPFTLRRKSVSLSSSVNCSQRQIPPSSNTSSSSSSSSSSSASSSSRERKGTSLPWPTANEAPARGRKKNGTTKIICLEFTGRLANEMFEYASILGLAATMKRAPLVLGSAHLVKVLQTFPYAAGNDSRLIQRCRNATPAFENAASKFKEQLTKLDPTKDYRTGLYLQSYRYFLKHWPRVRDALTFSDAILNETRCRVRQLREEYSSTPTILIGVHIRHGDMAYDRNVKLGYPIASQDYIKRALSYYLTVFPGHRCVFVVASDSMEWCKANFPGGYHVRFLEPRSPEVDMLTVASLDHVVISFGSYSWWVGFLNPGFTVFMKDFLVNDTFVARTFNPGGRDYIYPGWIPV